MQGIVARLKKPLVFLMGISALGLYNQVLPPAAAGEVSRIWYELYVELNPGHTQVVHDALFLQSVSDWAKREQDRLEPIVLDILQGMRPDTPWTRVLSVTRAIPTDKIREVLFQRIVDIRKEAGQSARALDKAEHMRIAFVMATMAEVGDARCTEFLNKILTADAAAGSMESYLKTLQTVGDASSIRIVKNLDTEHFDASMTRLSQLTVKIIEGRLGKSLFVPDATQGLNVLAGQLLEAMEQGNFKGFVSLFAVGHAETLDEERVTREIFESDEGVQLRVQLRAALNKPLKVSQTELMATLQFGDKHALMAIFEEDGWKLVNLR